MANCTRCGKRIGNRDQGTQYEGKNVCGECFRYYLKQQHDAPPQALRELPNENIINSSPHSAIGKVSLNAEVNRAILWQKDEVPVGQTEGKEFFEDRTVSIGARVGHNGFLVVTNQRLLFACKLGMLAKEYAVIYGANLENIITVSHGRFGFNDKLVILENNNQHRDFVRPQIHTIIPTINSAISERKNQIQAQKEKEHIHIVLDFSSLKDVMSKGGVIMTTYKCPNCNGMVNIPEAGKVLMCQYCGTPIKPVDIFEKIKSLIL